MSRPQNPKCKCHRLAAAHKLRFARRTCGAPQASAADANESSARLGQWLEDANYEDCRQAPDEDNKHDNNNNNNNNENNNENNNNNAGHGDNLFDPTDKLVSTRAGRSL